MRGDNFLKEQQINKIIYFDKETIRNILQELDRGDRTHKSDSYSSVKKQGEINAQVSGKVRLDVPFLTRVSFLFTGKIDTSYLLQRDSITTITSTEISEFEKLKSSLKEIKNVQLTDIENSSTSLRVAGGYLRIIKGGIDELDTKEFKHVMDSYDGYDTYKVEDNIYVRFNNTAFVSNYKRNDLLTTTMTLYCIPVGEFDKMRFDFIEEVSRMERLFTKTNQVNTLADAYPPNITRVSSGNSQVKDNSKEDKVKLFDVVYACIEQGG